MTNTWHALLLKCKSHYNNSNFQSIMRHWGEGSMHGFFIRSKTYESRWSHVQLGFRDTGSHMARSTRLYDKKTPGCVALLLFRYKFRWIFSVTFFYRGSNEHVLILTFARWFVANNVDRFFVWIFRGRCDGMLVS